MGMYSGSVGRVWWWWPRGRCAQRRDGWMLRWDHDGKVSMLDGKTVGGRNCRCRRDICGCGVWREQSRPERARIQPLSPVALGRRRPIHHQHPRLGAPRRNTTHSRIRHALGTRIRSELIYHLRVTCVPASLMSSLSVHLGLLVWLGGARHAHR